MFIITYRAINLTFQKFLYLIFLPDPIIFYNICFGYFFLLEFGLNCKCQGFWTNRFFDNFCLAIFYGSEVQKIDFISDLKNATLRVLTAKMAWETSWTQIASDTGFWYLACLYHLGPKVKIFTCLNRSNFDFCNFRPSKTCFENFCCLIGVKQVFLGLVFYASKFFQIALATLPFRTNELAICQIYWRDVLSQSFFYW